MPIRRNKNLVFDLPEEIKQKIIYYNPIDLPLDVINKIMLYTSHPLSDLFKYEMKQRINELNKVQAGDYEYGGEDFTIGDETSFANYFFHWEEEGQLDIEPNDIYFIGRMNKTYITTLNEYNRNTDYSEYQTSVF